LRIARAAPSWQFGAAGNETLFSGAYELVFSRGESADEVRFPFTCDSKADRCAKKSP